MGTNGSQAVEGELARTVLTYNDTFKRLVAEAKQPGFSIEAWSELAAYVAVDEFERVGSFKEVVDWGQYVTLVHGWATACQYDNSLKGVTQAGNRVFLELEEANQTGEATDVVNSLTVWNFDAAGKLVHLDIYLQQAPQPKWGGAWKIEEV